MTSKIILVLDDGTEVEITPEKIKQCEPNVAKGALKDRYTAKPGGKKEKVE